MRVVVSIKAAPGGGNASQAARYIAYRDRDEEREGKEPRKLFSAKAESLSFWQAERVLTAGRAPSKDEVAHLAVSLKSEDFHLLGHDEATRKQALTTVTREAVAKIAVELNADELRWVAGIHRNTEHPHLHLLIHKEYVARETGASKRFGRMPEGALASRSQDENDVEKMNPGSFSQAFVTALDRAQERVRREPPRAEATKENNISVTEKWLATAQRNPSLAGRELTSEIILRSAEPVINERDPRTVFSTKNLDDSDYRSPYEQADWLGQQSQSWRDLYERGATIKGDIFIIPAEEHEISSEHDQPFMTSLSYAFERLENPSQANEFYTLAKTIAGKTADSRAEIEVFRHYYAELKTGDRAASWHETIDKTLSAMRELAGAMEALETRDSVEVLTNEISLEEQQISHAKQESFGSFNITSRAVNLRDEALRLPTDLSFAAQEKLVTQSLPALDRWLESGKEKRTLSAAIDRAIYQPELSEEEHEERFKISGFLKAYLQARMLDPETRALNSSAAFRAAHQQMTETTSSEELNHFAERFLRENLTRSEALRRHKDDPLNSPKPEIMPLNARERNLLFFGRAPEHHTAEMRELRYAWGESREQRTARVSDLRESRLQPTPNLAKMLTELDSRQSLSALKHYQASLLNDHMNNPGKLDLQPLYDRLPPHERTYLLEKIEAKKQVLVRPELSQRESHQTISERSETAPRSRGELPRESDAYREYMARMGAIEYRLLNEAVRQRQTAARGIVISKEEYQLSITEARSLLPAEDHREIRQQARNQAWEQLTAPEVSLADSSAYPLRETIAHLRENTQQRARLAHQALDEFVKDKVGATAHKDQINHAALTKLAPDDAHRWQALQEYATRTQEELYRGFESLDLIRRDIEQTRAVNATLTENREPSSEPDQRQKTAMQFSEKTLLALINDPLDSTQRKVTEQRSSDEQTRAAWVIESDQPWHFDRLPTSQELPAKNESINTPERDDADHEFSYER